VERRDYQLGVTVFRSIFVAKKKSTKVAPGFLDAWEDAWQKHWKKTGFSPYELNLPDSDGANRERNFFTQQRSPE